MIDSEVLESILSQGLEYFMILNLTCFVSYAHIIASIKIKFAKVERVYLKTSCTFTSSNYINLYIYILFHIILLLLQVKQIDDIFILIASIKIKFAKVERVYLKTSCTFTFCIVNEQFCISLFHSRGMVRLAMIDHRCRYYFLISVIICQQNCSQSSVFLLKIDFKSLCKYVLSFPF
jgi:hypothetical protein